MTISSVSRDSRSGSRGGHFPCEEHASRIQRIDDLVKEQADRNNAQMVVVHGSISRLDLKMDRILEGIQIGAIVSTSSQQSAGRQSLGWGPEEQTNPGVEGAKMWKDRANRAAIAMVREKTRANRAIIAAVTSAIVTVITAVAATVQLFLSK
jgi:hypothetical protein